MSRSFQQKWDASPFDENSDYDRIAETARKAVIATWLNLGHEGLANDGEGVSAIAGGLLLGHVCILASFISDEDHDKLRAGLLQTIPWAVDMMRDMSGLPPLPEA